MTKAEFRSCLVAYDEERNDYRYVLTKEQAEYIEKKLPENHRKKPNLTGKCGSCKFAVERKHGKCIYVLCTNTEKHFVRESTRVKLRTEKGCKYHTGVENGNN